MTPKEKAKEIYSLFDDCTSIMLTVTEDITEEDLTNHAKQCAKICVKEIIQSLTIYGDENYELQNMDRTLAYYEQVLKEIDNL